MKMILRLTFVLLLSIVVSIPAVASPAWEKEFNALCGATSEAQDYDIQQLRKLVERCDVLFKEIEKKRPQQTKVILQRLERCRNYFEYLVQTKEQDKNIK